MPTTAQGLAHLILTGLMTGALAGALPAHAETALARVFAAAWQRQPAAAALPERTRAAEARQAAAAAWTPVAPSLEIGARSDRFHRQRGAEEREIGLVLPLWLPGERPASQALADAERHSVDRRTAALRLQLAQTVREAWWAWQAGGNEAELANGRVQAALRLRDDVARRYAAGELSRADLNLAEGALAQAEGLAAEAEAAHTQARFRLLALTGPGEFGGAPAAAEPEPPADSAPVAVDAHPQSLALAAQVARAEAEAELARQQTRASPSVVLSSRQDRPAVGEVAEQSLALSLRLPFGAGPRQDARVADARAAALELRQEAAQAQDRLRFAGELAGQQLAAARRQVAAAERRAGRAQENLALFDKAFRLGESDLPTRLRVEAEAFEAERALQRARIALAQGISQWRQALGLLPE